MNTHLMAAAAAVLALLTASTASAELTKADKKKIKRKLESGTLYLRMDAPCATGRHPYGVYKRPLVEITPEGSNMEVETTMTASFFHADSTYWGIRINDPVVLDEVDVDRDDGEVEIELEGVGQADDVETVLKFVEIYSMEDFEKAFEHAFSTVPLQDLHDDWSEDMKRAVADRKLVDGMLKRQAFYIVGTPERFEKTEEEGRQVEVWHLRTDRGVKTGYFTSKAKKSDLPAMIRFEGGKLTRIGSSGSGQDDSFTLD
ncbi:MAG: hypothetical protein AAF725_18665 [Acidobacteriota bacterium]